MSDDQTFKLGKAPVSGHLLATEGYLYMLDKEATSLSTTKITGSTMVNRWRSTCSR